MNLKNLIEITQIPQYFEVLKYVLFSSLFLQFFIHSYLLKNRAIDRSISFSRYLPAEILGRFRDFTKKNNSKLNMLYYVQLILGCTAFIMFVPIALSDVEFSNPIVKIVIVPLSVTAVLMVYINYVQLSDKYYK